MGRVLRWLPAVVLVGYVCVLWGLTDTPPLPALAYGAAFLWVAALPGVLLYRALDERHDSLLTDLAMGTTVGLVTSMVVWLLLTAAGVNWLFLGWPLLVVATTLLPGWRRVWRIDSYETRPGPAALWGLVAAAALVLGRVGQVLGGTRLPPAANHWYQDAYWHMALSAQLMHSVPPDLPQVAGQPFWYHWFANAHIAAVTSASGIDLNVAYGRLWMPVVIAVGLAMMVVVGKQLTGAYWPGALAAACSSVGAAVLPAWFSLFGFGVFNEHSPSQQFSVPVILLTVSMLIELLRRGRLSAGGWVLLAIGVIGCSGAKGSALPVLICGMAAATAMSLLLRRDRFVASLLGFGVTTLALVATMPLTSGGSAGIGLQLFSTVRATQPWSRMLGGSPAASLEPVLPGLDRAGAPALLALILLSYLIAWGYVWVSVPAWRPRELEVWLLLGIGVAGFGAMMLVNQDGLSQVYFMSGAVIAFHLLAAVGAHWAWTHSARARTRAVSAGAGLIGAGTGGLVLLVARVAAGGVPQPTRVNASIATGLGVWLGFCAVGLAAVALSGRWRPQVWLAFVAAQFSAAMMGVTSVPARMLPAAPWAFSAALLALGLVVAVRPGGWVVRFSVPLLAVGATAMTMVPAVVATNVVANRLVPRTERTVTAAETAAAIWLRDNSPVRDMVSTNVHCLAKKTVPHCDARSFWVSAFSQRAVMIEGWGYTSEAHKAHGVDGRRYANQPFHDAQLFALNEQAFAEPTAEVLDALKQRGVRWLFADTRASEISPELAQLAELVFSNDDVQVYRLK